MWSAAGGWWRRRRQRSTRCETRAWGNCAVAPSQASSLTPGGRLTRWSGVFCVARRYLTRRRSFDFRGTHALDFQRQGGHAGRTRGSCRRYRGSVSTHPSPQGPVGGRGCGRGSADGAGSAGTVSGVCGRAVSTGAFTAAAIGSARCVARRQCVAGKGYLSKADREREEEESFAGRAACASGDRVCHQWVGTSGTRPRFAAMVRRASRGRLLCRCWRPTCIASD